MSRPCGQPTGTRPDASVADLDMARLRELADEFGYWPATTDEADIERHRPPTRRRPGLGPAGRGLGRAPPDDGAPPAFRADEGESGAVGLRVRIHLAHPDGRADPDEVRASEAPSPFGQTRLPGPQYAADRAAPADSRPVRGWA